MNTYIYVGTSVTDAQSLAMVNRERDRGHRVILLTPSQIQHTIRLYGPITDYEISQSAQLHPDLPNVVTALESQKVA